MSGGSILLAAAILVFYFALVCISALSHFVPLTFDEAWSFLEFSRHGVGFSLSHYPLPNNHIAFSALQALVVPESFVAAEPALLRLGNLVCVAALLALLLHIVHTRLRLRGSTAALCVVALSLCSPLFTLYLFVGRGYLLGTVLLLAALHFGAIPGRRVATALLCGLATWTVPSFGFAAPGVLLAVLRSQSSPHALKRAAQATALYAAVSLILYAPVFGDVMAQRTGWNEHMTALSFASQLWGLLGNAGTFGLALVANTILVALLGFALWRGPSGSEALAWLAPVASFLFVVGLLTGSGITDTPFLRTASFAPLLVWLALVVSVSGNSLLERAAGVLVAFNVIAGLLLFAVTLATGDPQKYPTLAGLSPSPLARADQSWLAKGARVEMEWDAVPVGRLYGRRYAFDLKRVESVSEAPCAGAGRFPPREKNRVAIARGSRLICF